MARPASPATDDTAASEMDRIYRLQRHIYDLTRKYYLLGRDQMIADLAPPAGGRVLEVGCGTGRNLILAARRYPDATFYGFDVSEAMLATADRSIGWAGISGRIRLAKGDASAFSTQALFGVDGFDRVFISYALSMIPAWSDVLEQSFAALAPGGSLHIVDFGEQTGYPPLFRQALRAWLRKFSVEPRAALEDQVLMLARRYGCKVSTSRPWRDYARYVVVFK